MEGVGVVGNVIEAPERQASKLAWFALYLPARQGLASYALNSGAALCQPCGQKGQSVAWLLANSLKTSRESSQASRYRRSSLPFRVEQRPKL